MAQFFLLPIIILSLELVAQPTGISHIKNLVGEAEYSEALQSLGKIDLESLSSKEKQQFFWIQGTILTAKEKYAEAQVAFGNFLGECWLNTVPKNTSPKIAEIFQTARTKFFKAGRAKKQFKIWTAHPDSQPLQNPIQISLHIESLTPQLPKHLRVNLSHRPAGSSTFTTIELKKYGANKHRITLHDYLLGDPSRGRTLEFFYTIFHKDEVLFQTWSAGAPLFITMTPAKAVALSEKKKDVHWGVWVGTSVALLGSIIAGSFLLTSNSTQPLKVEIRPPVLK